MKAFLSHSSKDKHFVRQVAEALGNIQVEYDETTFEQTLNTQAIWRALNRCDLYVLFLSAHSTVSAFVSEEQRIALEARGKGILKRILIFSLDGTSYKVLPEWFRQINVVHQLSSAKACSRRIQSALLGIDAEEHREGGIYVGREEEEKALRRALSAPPGTAPVALHAVGHYGIGRRTFLRHSLKKLFPRLEGLVEVTLSPYQGIEEFYRSLYALHCVSSRDQIGRDFEHFSNLSSEEQVSKVVEIVQEMAQNGEFIFVVDEGSVYDDAGDYQPYLVDIIKRLALSPAPVLGFIQTRMMSLTRRSAFKGALHTYLRPLSDEQILELLSFSFKQASIEFTAKQIDAISQLLDGHPFNVRFATQYVKAYGIDSLIGDPSELIEWKRRRAEDFLDRIAFELIDVEILAILNEYRFVATDMLISIVSGETVEVIRRLRGLEELCCVERREQYFHIAAPLRDALRRDARFDKSDEWKQRIGASICEAIRDYKDEDHISVPILESATIAAATATNAPAFLSNLILPSHLLRIARDYYDQRKSGICIEFCKRAFDMKARLTIDGQIEVLRLWGLSAIRIDDNDSYKMVLHQLKQYGSNVAKRNGYFLEGFFLRRHDRLDEAEDKFRSAWKLNRDNQSINRELASLYCKQRRYPDAEHHARAAYAIAPTNPFIIDILAETLLGKMQFGLSVDMREVNRILGELKIYGDAPGSSFYLIRDAQRRARIKDFSGALIVVNRAVERTPALITPYFVRADLHLSLRNIPEAEEDLAKINELLTQAGGFSEGDEAQVHDLEVRIMIEKEQYKAAKNKIDTSA